MPGDLLRFGDGRATSAATHRMAHDGHAGRSAFDVRELLFVLRRNIVTIGLFAVASTALTYWIVSQERAQFVAKALIRVHSTSDAGLSTTGNQAPRATGGDADPMLSRLMVLTGRRVAGVVVDKEGLRLFDPELGAPWARASDVIVALPPGEVQELDVTFGPTDVTATLGNATAHAAYGQPVELPGLRFVVRRRPPRLARQLMVVPRESAVDWVQNATMTNIVPGTDAVNVLVASPTPALSVRIANALIDEFRRSDLAQARASWQRQGEFLERALQQASDKLRSEQAGLASEQIATGSHDPALQSDAQSATALVAEQRLQQITAEQSVRDSLLAVMNASHDPTQSSALRALLALPDVASDPGVADALRSRASLEAQRVELVAAGRPSTYPDVVRIHTLMDSLDHSLVDAVRARVRAPNPELAALRASESHAETNAARLSSAEPELAQRGQRVASLQSDATTLRERLQAVRLREAAEGGNVEIVDPAVRAVAPRSRKPMEMVLGLAFGILLGVAVALLRHALGGGVHGREELEQALQIPGLVVVPPMPHAARWRRVLGAGRTAAGARLPRRASARTGGNGAAVRGPELVTIGDTGNSAAGAYRALRTRLLFSPQNGTRLRTLVVTSPSAGEGKTTTAANLAVTLAQQGMRVLLVDSDLRQPRLHVLFSLRNDIGLADVLLDRCALDEAIQPSGVDGLYFLGSGRIRPGTIGPSELLGGKGLPAFLAQGAGQFDVIVLDSPPVTLAPDASILAARAEGTLMVLRAGRTRRTLARDALVQLVAVGGRVVGAVLNDPDARAPNYHGYSRQYSY